MHHKGQERQIYLRIGPLGYCGERLLANNVKGPSFELTVERVDVGHWMGTALLFLPDLRSVYALVPDVCQDVRMSNGRSL